MMLHSAGSGLCALLGAAGLLAAALPAAAQTERMEIDELKRQLDAGAEVLMIDVREDHEVASGSIPGAVHIPVGELEDRMSDIPKDVRLVFF